MSTIYSTATVCMLDNSLNCLTLEPGKLSLLGPVVVKWLPAAVKDRQSSLFTKKMKMCLFGTKVCICCSKATFVTRDRSSRQLHV